jgi:hypothetical protein
MTRTKGRKPADDGGDDEDDVRTTLSRSKR